MNTENHKQCIISTLAYYDLFNYPLTLAEINRFCHYISFNKVVTQQTIDELIHEGVVFKTDSFYSLRDDRTLQNKRTNGNKLAEKRWKIARPIARFISFFPYVRGVWVSGSLSKNYMEKSSDIDFFIVTEPDKLWVCRSLLILFKKIMLLNSHKYFCVNYFIDSQSLQIPDQNIFTATELVTMVPVTNPSLYNHFKNQNQWVSQYFPFHTENENKIKANYKKNIIQNFVEPIFNLLPVSKIDTWCMNKTVVHWRKKFNHLSEEEFNLQLRSYKTVSKHHPLGFQQKIVSAHKKNVEHFIGIMKKHQSPNKVSPL